MKSRIFTTVLCLAALVGFVFTPSVSADVPAKILIGEPATLSGKHAKAGEQSTGGVEAIVNWA